MTSNGQNSNGVRDIRAKVLFLGSQGVGKTSILLRYSGEAFCSRVKATIGASFTQSTVQLKNNTTITLNVWDTAGQERFRSLVSMYYRNAVGAFIVFDITNENSFYDVRTWVEELERFAGPVCLCLIGNKSDLEHDRQVSSEQARELASTMSAQYFETSAKDNSCITEAFQYLAEGILQSMEQQHEQVKNWLVSSNAIRLDETSDSEAKDKKRCSC